METCPARPDPYDDFREKGRIQDWQINNLVCELSPRIATAVLDSDPNSLRERCGMSDSQFFLRSGSINRHSGKLIFAAKEKPGYQLGVGVERVIVPREKGSGSGSRLFYHYVRLQSVTRDAHASNTLDMLDFPPALRGLVYSASMPCLGISFQPINLSAGVHEWITTILMTDDRFNLPNYCGIGFPQMGSPNMLFRAPRRHEWLPVYSGRRFAVSFVEESRRMTQELDSILKF